MSLMEQKRNETPLEEARRKWGAQRVEACGLRKVERQGARGIPRERGRSEPRTSIGNPERSLPPGVYVTSQLQEPNYGFYQIFKLRDVMSDAGLNDCKRFDSLLCRLRDEEQVQLHARDVTVHTPEENEKDFSMKTDTVWEPSPCPGLRKPSERPRKAWYEFCHAIPAARS